MSAGQRKIEDYLDGRVSLFELNNWSLEFGDEIGESADAESMDIAGLVTELVHDLGAGTIDEVSIRKQLANRVNYHISHRHYA